MRRISRRIAGAILIAAATALGSVTVAAARAPVDPTTLNPPPPDFFNATCEQVGHGIVCDLAFSDPAIVEEPGGMVCDGTELLVSQTRSVVGKRFYDAQGDLLRRHFREDYAGTLLDPTTGNVLSWVAHDTVIHDLAVAGDIATGRTSFTGQAFRVFVPGGGTVFTDAGRVIVDEATGEILATKGPHRLDDYFVRGDPDAIHAICDALG
ncbi:MAG TPA: hypothetical protein VFI69_00975 [Candidatus Limnocylindrales bacterium]|jgi:hypothetical protein|nr:hypothetical protein [Candidatus Limnocylindrales bacterium]